MADIKLVRLITGEDILGEVVDTDSKSVTIKNAVRVVVMPNKTAPDAPTVGLAPFCHWTSDKVIELNAALVLTTMEPITDFINQYNSSFGGLVVPSSKIITP